MGNKTSNPIEASQSENAPLPTSAPAAMPVPLGPAERQHTRSCEPIGPHGPSVPSSSSFGKFHSTPKQNQVVKKKLKGPTIDPPGQSPPISSQSGKPFSARKQNQATNKVPATRTAVSPSEQASPQAQPSSGGAKNRKRQLGQQETPPSSSQPEGLRLDAAIQLYADRQDLDKRQILDIIHRPLRSSRWSGQVDVDSSKATAAQCFWKEMLQVLPDHDVKAVRRIARRRWHIYEQRSKCWQPNEDERLVCAYEQFPGRWKKISEIVERSPDHCRDRWREHARYGGTRLTAEWTGEEEDRLRDAVRETTDQRSKERRGLHDTADDHFDACNNMWDLVSQKMGGTRSRGQCLKKWQRLVPKDGDQELDHKWQGYADLNDSTQCPQRRSQTPAQKAAGAAKVDDAMLGTMEPNCCAVLMQPGDLFGLVRDIVDAGMRKEEEIPWRAITRKHRPSRWSTADRRAAFEHLKHVVGFHHHLFDYLTAMVDHLVSNYRGEIEEVYQGMQSLNDETPCPSPFPAGAEAVGGMLTPEDGGTDGMLEAAVGEDEAVPRPRKKRRVGRRSKSQRKLRDGEC